MTDYKQPPELVQFCKWLGSQKHSEKLKPLGDEEFEDKLWLVLQKFIEEKGEVDE